MNNYKSKTKTTGLFFGSFNPIHNGHLIIASYMLNFTEINEIWFVVSPQNPFKKKESLLPNHMRLELVEEAIKGRDNIYACDIEFRLPTPSYTINTLTYLKEKYPKRKFSLIMGADNLNSFTKWKNFEMILQHYSLHVYPRPGVDPGELADHPAVVMTSAPVIEISSSFIRSAIKDGKDVSFFIPDAVYNYIRTMNLYK